MVAVASLVAIGIQQPREQLCQSLYFDNHGVAVPGADLGPTVLEALVLLISIDIQL